jgi:hypothetical protein
MYILNIKLGYFIINKSITLKGTTELKIGAGMFLRTFSEHSIFLQWNALGYSEYRHTNFILGSAPGAITTKFLRKLFCTVLS